MKYALRGEGPGRRMLIYFTVNKSLADKRGRGPRSAEIMFGWPLVLYAFITS